jgi:nucleoid-associated protein YgaU
MNDIFTLQLALPMTVFPPASRYNGLELAKIEYGGETLVYVRRRFLPQPEIFSAIGEHVVTQGERLDQIAAQAIGDPELFWRIGDANRAMRPEELTGTVGRRLVITLPEGVQGAS